MIPSRRFAGVWIATSLLITSAWATASKIPYDVVTATVALSPSQLAHIEQYLEDKVARLVEGDPEEVVRARRQLIEPLSWAGGTEIFNLAYSSAAAYRLNQAVKSDQLLVRLNAMIVVHALDDPGVLGLVVKGLADPNPAVRYWAGKSVSQSITDRLASDQQRYLLEALTKVMLTEKSERVLQRLLVAVVSLNIPEAATKLLDGLNNRVSLHAVNPNLPMGAALEGLRTLFIKMVEATANGQDIATESIRQIAMVAYRYLDLSAALLDLDLPNKENQSNYRDMIKLNDAILRWTVRQMPPEGGPGIPPTIQSELAAENWPFIRLRAEEWKRVLIQSPFSFGPVDLMVTIPDHP